MKPRADRGFTLIEVLIALAITAFVSSIAYASLSSVISGVEATRESAQRTHEVNRAWSVISRDLRQLAPRPVRDEFGEEEPAMVGGQSARFLLSFTRSGWHNTAGLQRSTLQRINYRVEDETLWRDSYPVLDRAGDTEPREVKLLEGVEFFEVVFLSTISAVEADREGGIDTRNWQDNWIVNSGSPGGALPIPAALEMRVQLKDLGEIRRLYELPPI